MHPRLSQQVTGEPTFGFGALAVFVSTSGSPSDSSEDELDSP